MSNVYKQLMDWKPLSPQEMARLTNPPQSVQVVRMQPLTEREQKYEFVQPTKPKRNLPYEFEFNGAIKNDNISIT